MNPKFLKRLQAQNERAFQKLVEDHSPRIFSVCLQYMSDHDTAEDMVQETFIQVYRSIDRFQGASDIGTWIYRIAINTCKDELRKRKTQKRMTIHNTLARSEEEGERWQNSISEHIQADAQILKNENTKALYDAIYQLTADQQSAFVMYYLDEKSVKDVAEILQKSPKAVESLLHRARCQMKILLQEHYQNMQS